MAKGHYLAEFELYVMSAVARLGDNAYGMTIRREIEERCRRPVLRSVSGSSYTFTFHWP